MSSLPAVIGLCGGMGSGKTTFARHLSSALGVHCKTMAFGDALKRLVSEVYKIPLDMLYTESGKSSVPDWASSGVVKFEEVPRLDHWTFAEHTGGRVHTITKVLEANMAIAEACVLATPTCGRLLQIVGESCRRCLGERVWIDVVEDELRCQRSLPSALRCVLIIDDVRYDNEARWIKGSGGVLIKIDSDAPTKQSVAGRDLGHASELGLARYTERDYDYIAVLRDRNYGNFESEAERIASSINASTC